MKTSTKLAIQAAGGSLLIMVGINQAFSCSNKLAGYLDKISYYCVPIALCVSPSSCAENNFTGNYQSCTQTYSILNTFLESQSPAKFASIKRLYDPAVTNLLGMVYNNYQAGKTFSPEFAAEMKKFLPQYIQLYNQTVLRKNFCSGDT